MFDTVKKVLGGLKRRTPPSRQMANEFVHHLMHGDTIFRFAIGTTSLDALWDEALRIEPRLVYTVTSYGAMNRGAYHDVYITYRPKMAIAMEDIVILEASTSVETLRDALIKMPTELYAVINNSDMIKPIMDALLNGGEIPQLTGIQANRIPYLGNSENWCCFQFVFSYDTTTVNTTANKVKLDTELARIESILHLNNLLPEVKVFLALSYIAQETQFSLDGGNSAYDALCKKKASARGFAEGYAELLNYAGITSRVLEGRNNAIPGVDYAWVVVKLQGHWYHVDPAVTLQGDQLYLGAFLCPNSVMRQDYTWSDPVDATGFLYDASQVLSTVRTSVHTLLRMGIPEKYVNPKIEE